MVIPQNAAIAVIGAGAMGAGIAQIAAAAGHPVRVIDSQQAALDRGREGVAKSLASLVKRGTLSLDESETVQAHILWTTDLTEARAAVLVIEAIVEKLDIKLNLFMQLADILPPDAILASNTSSLSIEAMAAQLPDPARFVGLHFFNPAPVMKLVEVIPSSRTSGEVIETLAALMRAWAKRPVRVRDVPGFIVNRVARPYYAEGFVALGEGMDAAAIDLALTGAGGFRMGPLALADMIGHDINYTVARSVFDAYAGRTRFRPQSSQQTLFDQGRLGRKSGAGVYDYSIEKPPIATISPDGPSGRVRIGPGSRVLTPLAQALQSAGEAIETDVALAPEQLKLGEHLFALGNGLTLAERPGLAGLIDHARDFGTADVIALTIRNEGVGRAMAALLDKVGKRAISVPDRPGQIVLRTLAQLANAAADAVEDDVADADAVDEAMIYGANHPEGPLAWSRRAGFATVATALSNIASATGDDIYRPSPMFMRQANA